MNLSAIRSLPARRGVRLAFYWIVGLFVFLMLFGYFALPPIVRWAVESQGSKALGRAVTVGKIGFNPLTLTATVESLKIAEADGKGEFFGFKLLEANVDSSSLWHRGVVLKTLRLDEPKIHVVRGEDLRYSFGDILDRFASKPKTEPESGETTRFSLNNIRLDNGSIVFEDQPSKRRHVIERLNIGVPFVSNFPASVDIFQTPKIGAVVNGTPLTLEGRLKPFANHREAILDLALSPVDLTQYIVYVPGKMPVKIERAKLQTDLRLSWSHAGESGQKMVVNGTAKLSDVVATELDGSPLVAFNALAFDVTSLEPLAAPIVAKVAKIQLDGLALDVHRGSDGLVNLQRLAGSGNDKEPPASEQSGAPAQQAKPPVVLVDSIELNKATVRWSDEAVAGGFKLAVTPIDLQVKKLDLSGDTPAQISLEAKSDTGEKVSHNGEFVLSKGSFKGQVAVGGLSLERLRPYFNDAVGPAGIQGTLEAKADYAVENAKTTPTIHVSKAGGALSNLAISASGEKQPLVSVADIRVDDAAVDLEKREVALGVIGSKDARWNVVRSHEGTINLLAALLPAATKQPSGAKASGTPNNVKKGEKTQTKGDSPAMPVPWKISLGQAELAGWNVTFDDRSGKAPVTMNVRDLGVVVKDWSNKPGSMATADIKAKVNKKGQLAVAGRFATEPLKGDLKLDLKAVDLISIQPYVDEHFRVLVTHGAISARGALGFDLGKPERPQARYVGDLAIEDFNSLDQINDTDFMRWKRFAFNGIRFDLTPLAVTTSEVRLEDFYTRLILDAQGRFNVRELATVEDAQTPPAAGQSAPAAVAASAPGASSPSALTPSAPLPVVKVDKVVLTEGHVNYSDRFVKPNYDANLRGVSGTLSGLSTDQTSLAQLDLHAKLDGSAPVEVSGQLNPFRHDSFLDIKADVSDVDLTGVSTYSAKYVGYGIEKGKLSMSLEYKIRDRVLTARNQVNLDQLTFGDKVESPQATKLPVLFAVALMKNSRGEIDVDLPISGTLDDPQFSVGGIIVRVIVNLITKAITAPFSLLGSMFGGGEELSSIDFPAGLASLTPAAEEKLKSLSKALTDRPALNLEITGLADPAADRLGLKRAVLESRMRALKAAAMVKRGQEVADVDSLPIDPQEYPQWLEAVYSAEKIPNKPRNAIGLAKKLPAEEMEKMLLDYLLVSDADVQALGARRAQTVRDWFVASGLDPDRVFLLNVTSAAGKREGKPVSPRVEFSLK